MLRVPELPQELTPITAPGSTSARQHPCTTSGTHANKSNTGPCEAAHTHTTATNHALDPPPTRPPVCCHIATCHHAWSAGRPSPIGQKPADDATSGGQKRPYMSKLGVALRSSGWARPRRARLAKKEQSDRDRDHAWSGGSIPAGSHRRGARLSSSPDPRRRSITSTLSRSLWRKPK